MPEINFDQAGQLDIRVAEQHSWVLSMDQFEDEEETIPMDFTGIHKIVISRDKAGKSLVYEIDESNILKKTGNNITIDFTTSLNTIKPTEKDHPYYLDWRCDIGGHSVPVARGFAHFNHTQARP